MENRKHILSAEELKAYVRPISRHVEDEDVETFIRSVKIWLLSYPGLNDLRNCAVKKISWE